MTVASMESAGRRRDVIFTTESKKGGGFRITAHELSPNHPATPVARTVYTSPYEIQFLKTAREGSVIAATAGKRVLVGLLRSTDYDTIDKIRYEFRVFDSSDLVKTLDIRVSSKTETVGKKASLKKTPIVDLVVGDVRGVVFVHEDIVTKLFSSSKDSKAPAGIEVVPRKLHWHRQAVQTVKWSKDGK